MPSLTVMRPVTISNEEEMEAAKKECYEEDEEEECFTLIYPVTFTLPDDSTVSGNEEEVWTAIKAWYEAHPDVAEEPELNYPVQIAYP